MAKFRGFQGEVSTMGGLDMHNAQGNYDSGRGRDGLNRVPSRFGAAVPTSGRPPAISGKPTPAPLLDPALLEPGETGEGFTTRQRFSQLGLWPPRAPSIYIRPTRARQRRPNKAALVRYRRQFLNWIKQWAPEIYVAAKKKADLTESEEGTLGQLGGWWETFSDSVGDLGGKYLQFRTQKEILDVQMERMRAGLPPLQTGEYAPTVAVKIDPWTTRELTGAIGAGFGKMLPVIAIGGVALMFLMGRRRRR